MTETKVININNVFAGVTGEREVLDGAQPLDTKKKRAVLSPSCLRDTSKNRLRKIPEFPLLQ